MLKKKMRMVLATGLLALAAFGGATGSASADKLCARVEHTIGTPESERLGIEIHISEPICVPLP